MLRIFSLFALLAAAAHAQPFTGDLAITDVSVSPIPVESGEDADVDFYVINEGPNAGQLTGYEIRVNGELLRSSSQVRSFSTQGLEVQFSDVVRMPEVTFEQDVTLEVTIFDNQNTINNVEQVRVRVRPVTVPDLTPDTPAGWSGPLTVADVQNTTQTQAVVASGRPLYADFAFRNDGAAIISAPVRVVLFLDGVQVFAGTYPPLGADERRQIRDVVGLGTPSIGVHTLEMVLDEDRTIEETDELNNSATITFRVEDGAVADLEFGLAPGSSWPAPVMLSDAVGGRTAMTAFDSGETIYANLAIRNAGATDTGEFSIDMLINGLVVDTVRVAGIPAGGAATVTDWVVVEQALDPGTVEFRLDAAGEVAEVDEQDNDAAISFTVGNAGCLADFNGDGFVDFFDYGDYVGAFEAGSPDADANGDGFIDFFDYAAFVAAFESGGC